MTKIIGIAGRKQSGKNTVANAIHGLVLKEKGMIMDFNIGSSGQLIVKTTDASNTEGWGEFDVTRKDNSFVQYAEHNMWPYIKLYSFADTLKWICMELFDIPYNQLFGTDKEKNKEVPHLLWENMPVHINDINTMKSKTSSSSPCMTSREFMQFFGTNIMRRMYSEIWVSNTMARIKKEGTELAIVCDVRFPNEVEAIKKEDGKVIKMKRKPLKDDHASEVALEKGSFDQSKFDYIIDNSGKCTIENLCKKVSQLYITKIQ